VRSGNAKIMEGLFDQIFDAFCVMAVNALKTKNDVNEAVKAGKGKQHAKENANMSNSDLRHAAASHFDNNLANLSKLKSSMLSFSITWKGISYLLNGFHICKI